MGKRTSGCVPLPRCLAHLLFSYTSYHVDIPQPLELNTSPEDLEAEELQAYADEYAALADFEDIPEDEWDLSDLDEPTSTSTVHATRTSNEAMAMEMDTS